MEKKELLTVKGLEVVFESRFNQIDVLKGVDFSLKENETVGLVGVNGSGKSTFALSLMGLLPRNAKIVNGSININGSDMIINEFEKDSYNRKRHRILVNEGIEKLRGRFITMVTQEAASYLDPLLTVGYQIFESVLFHNKERLIKRIDSREKVDKGALLNYVKLLNSKDYKIADKFLDGNFDEYIREQILNITRRDDLTDEDKKNLILALGRAKLSSVQRFVLSHKGVASRIPGLRYILNQLILEEGYQLAGEILGLMGLDPTILHMFPNQLSGGMLQAVLIASAIVNNPRIIIMDEPASSLDPIAQYKLFNLLSKIKATFNLSLILVAHDISLLTRFADRIAVIEDGAIVEVGDTSSVINNSSNEYTKRLIKSVINI